MSFLNKKFLCLWDTVHYWVCFLGTVTDNSYIPTTTATICIRIDSKISNKKVKYVLLKYNGCFENCAAERSDTRIGSLGLSRINEREGTKMYTFSTVAICQNCKRITIHLFGGNSYCYVQYSAKQVLQPLVVNLTP